MVSNDAIRRRAVSYINLTLFLSSRVKTRRLRGVVLTSEEEACGRESGNCDGLHRGNSESRDDDINELHC